MYWSLLKKEPENKPREKLEEKYIELNYSYHPLYWYLIYLPTYLNTRRTQVNRKPEAKEWDSDLLIANVMNHKEQKLTLLKEQSPISFLQSHLLCLAFIKNKNA